MSAPKNCHFNFSEIKEEIIITPPTQVILTPNNRGNNDHQTTPTLPKCLEINLQTHKLNVTQKVKDVSPNDQRDN